MTIQEVDRCLMDELAKRDQAQLGAFDMIGNSLVCPCDVITDCGPIRQQIGTCARVGFTIPAREVDRNAWLASQQRLNRY